MRHQKHKKEPANVTRASVKREMAKPRMSKSAKLTEQNLNTARIQRQPKRLRPSSLQIQS
jgi:hypothetical protein